MAASKARDSREDLARRGQELYDQIVRTALRPEDDGKFAAIVIESGSYDRDANDYAAVDSLRKRLPDAQIWLMRVGQRAAHRLGGARLDSGSVA